MLSEQEKDALREWRESAPYWAKHAAVVRSMFAPVATALIEAAEISERQAVLDVAGGVGEPALTIAEKVGASGSVAFTDAVEEMVSATKREARRRGLVNVEFCECLAESLPFPNDSFDVAVCRLGVMLFPDPYAAMREMLRVVKPEGRVSFAVWASSAVNPFFHVVTDVVSRYVPSPPDDRDAPGAFRFAENGKLARMLEGAGAIDVREQLLEFDLEAPLTPREFWNVRAELSDTLRSKVATLSAKQLELVAQEVEEAGGAFFVEGRMKFPAQVRIVTGKK